MHAQQERIDCERMAGLAGQAFDSAVGQHFAGVRERFLNLYGRHYFSDETHETLAAKLAICKHRMGADGRGLTEICDDPDVYLGYLDRDYLGYVLACEEIGTDPVPLEQWRRSHLYHEANRFIRDHL